MRYYNELDTSTKIILKVIFAFLALVFLWLIRDIVVIILLSLILGSAMDPLVNYLNKIKIPRIVSVLAVYGLVLAVAVLIVYLVIPPVLREASFLRDNLPMYNGEIHKYFGAIIPSNYNISDILKNLTSGISSGGGVLAKTFVFFNGVLSFIAVLIISIYLLVEEKGMKSFVDSLVPKHHHEFTMNLIDKIQKKMGLWVIGQVIICFGIFLFTFIGLTILHVKYALVLALLAGLFELVPYIGPFLSAVPAVLLAFSQQPSLAIAVIVLYILVHEFEGYVLVPKIMEKTVGTSPLVVLLALLIGLKLAGVVGVLISVPLATAITIVFREIYSARSTT